MAKIRLLLTLICLLATFVIGWVPPVNGQEEIDPSKYLQDAIKRYNTKKPVEHSKGPYLYLFFSFGMPKPSIERMAQDAERAGAILVMRGLIDNSGKKTREAIMALAKDHKIEVDIDPTVYRKFKIDQVPAVVLVKKFCATCQEPAAEGEFIKISGDVTLSYALEQLDNNYSDWHGVISPYQKRLEGEK
jgi:conjugal transfer pilus assembly protein TrbC